MTAEVVVLRNMPRERQIAALRRMLAANLERERLARKQVGAVLREINRLKRQEAEDAGHVKELLR